MAKGDALLRSFWSHPGTAGTNGNLDFNKSLSELVQIKDMMSTIANLRVHEVPEACKTVSPSGRVPAWSFVVGGKSGSRDVGYLKTEHLVARTFFSVFFYCSALDSTLHQYVCACGSSGPSGSKLKDPAQDWEVLHLRAFSEVIHLQVMFVPDPFPFFVLRHRLRHLLHCR